MLKITDKFFFDLKTLIPVSNLTHQIYLCITHNPIKTICVFLWYSCIRIAEKKPSQTKNPINIIAAPKTAKNDLFRFLEGYSHPKVSIWTFPSFEVKGDQNYARTYCIHFMEIGIILIQLYQSNCKCNHHLFSLRILNLIPYWFWIIFTA